MAVTESKIEKSPFSCFKDLKNFVVKVCGGAVTKA